MRPEPPLAFLSRDDPDGLEVRVNFGVFAAREATPAELDDLARALLPHAGAVSVVAEHRHEVAADVEASLHQVRVEIASDQLPRDPGERAAVTGRVTEAADAWARGCIADRHVEISEL